MSDLKIAIPTGKGAGEQYARTLFDGTIVAIVMPAKHLLLFHRCLPSHSLPRHTAAYFKRRIEKQLEEKKAQHKTWAPREPPTPLVPSVDQVLARSVAHVPSLVLH